MRAGWRIAFQLVLFLCAYILSVQFYFPEKSDYFNELINELAFFVFGMGTIYFAIKILDKRKIRDIGLAFKGRGIKNYSSGFLFGAGIFSVLFLIEIYMGWIEIEGMFFATGNINFIFEILGRFIGYTSVAILEESFSRGYQLKNIAEGLNINNSRPSKTVFSALIISSLIFSMLHAANPGATFMGLLNLTLIGILFGYSYIATGSLAFPIGLHTAWNFFQGHIFGFPVSGFKSNVSLFKIYHDGPDFLTGGSFGPEGGLVVLIIVVVSILAIRKFRKNLGYVPEFNETLIKYNS